MILMCVHAVQTGRSNLRKRNETGANLHSTVLRIPFFFSFTPSIYLDVCVCTVHNAHQLHLYFLSFFCPSRVITNLTQSSVYISVVSCKGMFHSVWLYFILVQWNSLIYSPQILTAAAAAWQRGNGSVVMARVFHLQLVNAMRKHLLSMWLSWV